MPEDLFLIVGLGNPGPRYAGNRHNVGHMVLDELASRIRATFKTHKTRAVVAEGRLGTIPSGAPGPRVVLAKPLSYMNVSGGPVSALARFYTIGPSRIIVVHDELDVDFGALKVKIGGGEGGHNGLRDISKAIGNKDYYRVRIGVGRPPGQMDAADYVLRDFSAGQRKELPHLLGEGADAVEMIVTEGLERTQIRFHTRR